MRNPWAYYNGERNPLGAQTVESRPDIVSGEFGASSDELPAIYRFWPSAIRSHLFEVNEIFGQYMLRTQSTSPIARTTRPPG